MVDVQGIKGLGGGKDREVVIEDTVIVERAGSLEEVVELAKKSFLSDKEVWYFDIEYMCVGRLEVEDVEVVDIRLWEKSKGEEG